MSPPLKLLAATVLAVAGTAQPAAAARPSATPADAGAAGRRPAAERTITTPFGRIQYTAAGVAAADARDEVALTVRTVDRAGTKPGRWQPDILVVNLDTGAVEQPPVAGGDATIRLPRGRYAIWSGILTELAPGTGRSVTLAVVPEVALTADTVVNQDARAGRPVTVRTDRPEARRAGAETGGVTQQVAGQPQTVAASVFDDVDLYVVPTGKPVAGLRFFDSVNLLQPTIELTAVRPDRYPVPTRYAEDTYSPRYVGDATLVAVDGGTGTPAELSTVDAKGRLVLLTPKTPADAEALAERVANVAKAGGVAVQLTSEALPANLEEPLVLPTMVTGSPAGARLLADARAGVARVHLRGLPASPYRYNLLLTRDGAVPADPTFRVRDRDLAAVRTSYATQAVDRAYGTSYVRADLRVSGWVSPERFTVPLSRTEYFSPGSVGWSQEFRNESSDNASELWGGEQVALRGPYRPGRYTERWNAAPIGPSTGTLEWYDTWFTGILPLYSDSTPAHAGNAVGYFGQDTGSTVVLRDGVELVRSDVPGQWNAEVPKAGGAYEVRVEAARSAPWTALASRQRATWSFRWADPDRPAPLLAVRYGADADDHGRAARRHILRVRVEQAVPAPVRDLAVEVSYDDGRTWAPVSPRRDGDHWTAALDPPRGAAFVSLRATAHDTAGNGVSQETIRAYGLR